MTSFSVSFGGLPGLLITVHLPSVFSINRHEIHVGFVEKRGKPGQMMRITERVEREQGPFAGARERRTLSLSHGRDVLSVGGRAWSA